MKTTALIAVAGLAAAATAQSATVSLIPSATTVAQGETFSIAVVVEFTGAAGLGLVNLNIAADPASGFVSSNGVRSAGFWTAPPAQNITTLGNGGAILQGGNLPLALSPAFLGGTIFTFDVTAGQEIGTFDYSIARNAPTRNAVQLFLSATAFSGTNVPDSFVGTSITVTPTPGAAGVLALGGLVAARRRRA